MNFFLNILNEKDLNEDTTDVAQFLTQLTAPKIRADDKLSINKLQSFQQIYNRCPMFTAQENNNS